MQNNKIKILTNYVIYIRKNINSKSIFNIYLINVALNVQQKKNLIEQIYMYVCCVIAFFY